MFWSLSGTNIDVDGHTFVPSTKEKALRPVWRGTGKPPSTITIDRHWQKWFKAFVGQLLGTEFSVETREFKTDLAVPRSTSASRRYLRDGVIERQKASPWPVPAARRTARSYTFRNDADGANVRSAHIHVARVGELKLEVAPEVEVKVAPGAGGLLRIFKIRGTAKLAIDPVILLYPTTGDDLANTLVDEFFDQAGDEGWFDSDADVLIRGQDQLRGLLREAFTLPADWYLSDADDPKAEVDEGKAEVDEGEVVQRNSLLRAEAPGIGFFALRCDLPDEAGSPFQISEPIAIEVEDSGEVHVYTDISVLDLRKAARPRRDAE